MRSICLLLIGLWLALSKGWAQQQVVHADLLSPFFGHVKLSYERVLGPRMTLHTQLGVRIPSEETPPLLLRSSFSGLMARRGGELTVMGRFYPGQSSPLRGMYWGPWLRYRHRGRSGDLNLPDHQLQTHFNLSTANAGVLLGYQWLIKDIFSIDWSILGIGWGYYRIRARYTVDGATPDWAAVEDYVNGHVPSSGQPGNAPPNPSLGGPLVIPVLLMSSLADRWLMPPLEVDPSQNKLSGINHRWLPVLRMGLSLGVAF